MLFKSKIGLALSGGGARGAAHIGVLNVLQELDVKIDVVTGTSAGGMVAAMLGASWTLEQMRHFFTETDFAAMVQLDRSGGGLISVSRFAETLRARFGDLRLETLEPRVALMAADVKVGQPVMLERGPVVEAILATTAVPGLFPPVEWGDHRLVDGGVIDNIPTQAAYQLGAEQVIAVDVNSRSDIGLMLGEVSPFAQRVRRALYWLLSLSRRDAAFDVLMRSSMLSLRVLEMYHLAAFPPTVLIRPALGDIGLFDMHRTNEAIDAGEREGRKAMSELKKLTARSWLPQRHRPKRPSLEMIA